MISLTFPVIPVLSVIAGVIILVKPRFLNYVVAFYLIAAGIIGLVR